MKKSILMVMAAITLTFGLVMVPKKSSAFVYDIYQHEQQYVGESWCNVYVRYTYNVDWMNQVTLVNRTVVYQNCN